MKRFLLSLLVLAMFTPGLACAKFMERPTPSMAQMAKDMPCCPKHTPSSDMGTMLFKDCAKIDLLHADDAPILKKQDIVKHVFTFTPFLAASHDFSFIKVQAARGPPFERRLGLSQAQLPIFLATQRLRI